MPDVREVFEMATQKVRPDPGALERQHRGQRRRTMQRKAGVYALVAALGLAAVVIAVRATTDRSTDRTPAAPERATDGVAIVDLEGNVVDTVGADGGEKTESLLRYPGLFTLSPDGSRLAVSNGSEVYTMNADGTELAKLADGVDPAWSPDGSLIAFSHQGTIRVISPDGTGARTVVGAASQNARWPEWSPNGDRIAYNMPPAPSSKGGIFVVDAEGGRPTRLTTGFDVFPSWHPDGTTIGFTRVGPTGDVFTVPADGSGSATPLAATDRGESVGSWSPSGDLLAYEMSSGVTQLESDVRVIDVHVLDMRTGEDRVVLEGARPLAWASDRTLVVEL